jgi:hypothetical protein
MIGRKAGARGEPTDQNSGDQGGNSGKNGKGRHSLGGDESVSVCCSLAQRRFSHLRPLPGELRGSVNRASTLIKERSCRFQQGTEVPLSGKQNRLAEFDPYFEGIARMMLQGVNEGLDLIPLFL